jgi:ABC-type ATPase with predicted acetyltransferase domain
MTIQELNKQLCIINRVVVHPKYRTIGLGAKLIHDTLLLVGTPYVELIAVMPKYSPFAERAGMQKVIEQQSIEGISNISETLSRLGFDQRFLGSERYVKEKLESLTSQQLSELKEAFMANKHPRLKKEAACQHQPYGITAEYVRYVKNAESQELNKLIKLVAILSQKKVYLFWENWSDKH